jgi:hypothetical protein
MTSVTGSSTDHPCPGASHSLDVKRIHVGEEDPIVAVDDEGLAPPLVSSSLCLFFSKMQEILLALPLS